MKTKLKVYKKISLFFSITIHAIILVLLIEGNKKKLFPKTSMIEVELKSSIRTQKKLLKAITLFLLNLLIGNMASKVKANTLNFK